jgi:glutathione S-transferase
MYILHRMPDSASTIVEIVLHELDLPYQVRTIDKSAGDLTRPDYLALHPLGLVPVLETPDGAMFETAAILLYLSETPQAEGHHLAPAPGTPDRAAFLKWLFFTSSNLHPTLLQTFYPERTVGPDQTEAVVALARAKLHIYLNLLNTVAETQPAWLSDTAPTLLGYYLAMLMRWIAPNFPSTNYPALHRVLAYLEQRPAVQTCAAAEGLGPIPFTGS